MFRTGSLTLTAVSAPPDAPPPAEECSAIILAPLLKEEGRVYNGGDLDGDFELETVFRLKTPQSVLTINIVFAGESRYVALMIPAAGWNVVRAVPPGKIGYMYGWADLAMDNAAIQAGATTTVRIVYTRYQDCARVFLDNRPVSIEGETCLAVAVPPFRKLFKDPSSHLHIYTEAQVSPARTSVVEVEAVRLTAWKRPLLSEAVLWLKDYRRHGRRVTAAVGRFWRLEERSLAVILGRFL
jgi:hypothetical protein